MFLFYTVLQRLATLFHLVSTIYFQSFFNELSRPHGLHVRFPTEMKRQYQEIKNGSVRDPRFRNSSGRCKKVLNLIDIEQFNGIKTML